MLVRSYLSDESGGTVKLVIPTGVSDAGTYLVTWNGHGDALALWRVEADGTLTLANSYTYDTWGRPTTATHNGIADLGFRFLYVGEFDVQWDDSFGLGLLYMHARHYSPALGRFLQPDPDRSEANLYAYAANSPVTEIDPDGTCFILCAVVNAVIDTAIYLATTEDATLEGAAGAAAFGAVTGFVGIGLLSKVAKIGTVARAVSAASRTLGRGAAAISRSSRVGATLVRGATRARDAVAPYLREQRSDWIRFGKTNVPPSASGLSKYVETRAIKGGGTNPVTGFRLPFHYHVHRFNWYHPERWFK